MASSFRLGALLVALPASASSAQSTDSTLSSTTSSTSYTSFYNYPINSWHVGTFTAAASTVTISATTITQSASEAILGYELPQISYPGVGVRPHSTSTVPAFTLTVSPTTETIASQNQIYTLPPDILVGELLNDFIYDLLVLAPSITSLPVAVASKVNVDYTSLWGSYTAAHPIPTIDSELFSQLDKLYQGNDPVSISLYNAIVSQIDVYPEPSQTASLSSALSSILAPYPSLSSEIREWQSAIRQWRAPEFIAELQMLTSDLSITSVADPTFFSIVSAAAVQATATTSSSTAGAVPTAPASVLVNAGLAAAGMALVGMM